MRSFADLLGWFTYLAVMGGGLMDPEFLVPSAQPGPSPARRAGPRGTVVRLADYREQRRAPALPSKASNAA